MSGVSAPASDRRRRGNDLKAADKAAAIYDRATSRVAVRTSAEIARLFTGFALVSPGLVDVSQWPDEAVTRIHSPGLRGLAGVGRRVD